MWRDGGHWRTVHDFNLLWGATVSGGSATRRTAPVQTPFVLNARVYYWGFTGAEKDERDTRSWRSAPQGLLKVKGESRSVRPCRN